MAQLLPPDCKPPAWGPKKKIKTMVITPMATHTSHDWDCRLRNSSMEGTPKKVHATTVKDGVLCLANRSPGGNVLTAAYTESLAQGQHRRRKVYAQRAQTSTAWLGFQLFLQQCAHARSVCAPFARLHDLADKEA